MQKFEELISDMQELTNQQLAWLKTKAKDTNEALNIWNNWVLLNGKLKELLKQNLPEKSKNEITQLKKVFRDTLEKHNPYQKLNSLDLKVKTIAENYFAGTNTVLSTFDLLKNLQGTCQKIFDNYNKSDIFKNHLTNFLIDLSTLKTEIRLADENINRLNELTKQQLEWSQSITKDLQTAVTIWDKGAKLRQELDELSEQNSSTLFLNKIIKLKEDLKENLKNNPAPDFQRLKKEYDTISKEYFSEIKNYQEALQTLLSLKKLQKKLQNTSSEYTKSETIQEYFSNFLTKLNIFTSLIKLEQKLSMIIAKYHKNFSILESIGISTTNYDTQQNAYDTAQTSLNNWKQLFDNIPKSESFTSQTSELNKMYKDFKEKIDTHFNTLKQKEESLLQNYNKQVNDASQNLTQWKTTADIQNMDDVLQIKENLSSLKFADEPYNTQNYKTKLNALITQKDQLLILANDYINQSITEKEKYPSYQELYRTIDLAKFTCLNSPNFLQQLTNYDASLRNLDEWQKTLNKIQFSSSHLKQTKKLQTDVKTLNDRIQTTKMEITGKRAQFLKSYFQNNHKILSEIPNDQTFLQNLREEQRSKEQLSLTIKHNLLLKADKNLAEITKEQAETRLQHIKKLIHVEVYQGYGLKLMPKNPKDEHLKEEKLYLYLENNILMGAFIKDKEEAETKYLEIRKLIFTEAYKGYSLELMPKKPKNEHLKEEKLYLYLENNILMGAFIKDKEVKLIEIQSSELNNYKNICEALKALDEINTLKDELEKIDIKRSELDTTIETLKAELITETKEEDYFQNNNPKKLLDFSNQTFLGNLIKELSLAITQNLMPEQDKSEAIIIKEKAEKLEETQKHILTENLKNKTEQLSIIDQFIQDPNLQFNSNFSIHEEFLKNFIKELSTINPYIVTKEYKEKLPTITTEANIKLKKIEILRHAITGMEPYKNEFKTILNEPLKQKLKKLTCLNFNILATPCEFYEEAPFDTIRTKLMDIKKETLSLPGYSAAVEKFINDIASYQEQIKQVQYIAKERHAYFLCKTLYLTIHREIKKIPSELHHHFTDLKNKIESEYKAYIENTGSYADASPLFAKNKFDTLKSNCHEIIENSRNKCHKTLPLSFEEKVLEIYYNLMSIFSIPIDLIVRSPCHIEKFFIQRAWGCSSHGFFGGFLSVEKGGHADHVLDHCKTKIDNTKPKAPTKAST